MITPFQVLTFCIYCASVVLAIYFGSSIAEDGLLAFVKIAGVIAGLAWLGFGSSIWWLPLFFGIGLGGEFYFGFKILSHEAGFLAALAALLPSAMLMRMRSFSHRKGLPILLWFFLLYLAIHCSWSILKYAHADLVSVGSVGRNYFTAAWGPLFLILFYYYGSSQRIVWALYAVEIAYFIRTACGVAFFISPSLAYLPGVNFILPGSMSGGTDLRFAGLGLGQIALALLFDRKWMPWKPFHLLMIPLSVTALLMGGGRGGFISFVVILFLAALYARNWFIRIGLPLLMATVVVLVNLNPQWIDSLPPSARRSASILIIKEQVSLAQHETASSDQYHQKLNALGLQRWLENPRTFLFGLGAQPYDWSVLKESNGNELWELLLVKAADSGNYEVALWSILAIMGITALLFYVALFTIFQKKVWDLSDIAERDRYGRVFSFLAYCLPLQWYGICFLQGNVPSYELTLAGLAFIYLQDRKWEEENRNRKPTPSPAIPLPA